VEPGCSAVEKGLNDQGGFVEQETHESGKNLQLGKPGGGENQEQGHGRVYATTLGILSLSVKYHYLPIYQR